MEVEVRMPARLGEYIGEEATVVADGQTIREVMGSLFQMFDGLSDELIDEVGEIRQKVIVRLNDEDVQYIAGIDTAVKEGDVISIIPAA